MLSYCNLNKTSCNQIELKIVVDSITQIYSPVDQVYIGLKTCNMAVITKNLATIPNLPFFILSTLAFI